MDRVRTHFHAHHRADAAAQDSSRDSIVSASELWRLSEARHGEDARSDQGGFRLRAEIVAARTLAAFVASSYVAELRGFEAEIELLLGA